MIGWSVPVQHWSCVWLNCNIGNLVKKIDISNLSGNAVVGPGAVVELTDSSLLLLTALPSPLQSNNRKQGFEFIIRALNIKANVASPLQSNDRGRDMNSWVETWILKLMSPVHFNLTIATRIKVRSRDLNIKANVASPIQSNNPNRDMNLWVETWILKLRLPRILPILWSWIQIAAKVYRKPLFRIRIQWDQRSGTGFPIRQAKIVPKKGNK